MNIKITVVCLIVISVLNVSPSYAKSKKRLTARLAVLSVVANHPKVVPQKMCEKWFNKKISIRSKLERDEEASVDSGVFYVNNDKGVYTFAVNKQKTQILYADFYHEIGAIADKSKKKNSVNTAPSVRVSYPAEFVLRQKNKYKVKTGFVKTRYCTAMVEGNISRKFAR